MDAFALQTGNLLVGNPRGAAALEMCLRGPTLTALADAVVCLCGSELGAALDGRPMPAWKCLRVPAGGKISFPGGGRGVWGYLCAAGGIDVPPVLGSRSTCLKAGFGGLEGRPLRAGDVLPTGRSEHPAPVGRALKPSSIPALDGAATVRVVSGPEQRLFAAEDREAFDSSWYTVTPSSDRMGTRLRGRGLVPSEAAGLPSEGVAMGIIQVPPDGQPIVLMADRQTTGGYAVIATVISADLPVLAQLRPGSSVRFRRVGVEEAQESAARMEAFLREFAAACGVRDQEDRSPPLARI
jgi:antagonist of KipI